MALVATWAIETKRLPAIVRVIDEEVETTAQQTNVSLFTGFFVSKPKPTKVQVVKSPPYTTTQVTPAKAEQQATTTHTVVLNKQKTAVTQPNAPKK